MHSLLRAVGPRLMIALNRSKICDDCQGLVFWVLAACSAWRCFLNPFPVPQALLKNATEAMKESRVFEVLTTVSDVGIILSLHAQVRYSH